MGTMYVLLLDNQYLILFFYKDCNGISFRNLKHSMTKIKIFERAFKWDQAQLCSLYRLEMRTNWSWGWKKNRPHFRICPKMTSHLWSYPASKRIKLQFSALWQMKDIFQYFSTVIEFFILFKKIEQKSNMKISCFFFFLGHAY